ncbi:MAG: ABC-2 family transporter protein [Chloroflexia bacterium]
MRPAPEADGGGAAVRRYARLWLRFAATEVARLTEYRLNFATTVVEGVAQTALAVLTFVVLFQFTDELAGWSRMEALMLAGCYRMVDGVVAAAIAPNMYSISGYIRRGEMDFMLLRPVSSQFLVSFRRLNLPEAVNIPIGLGLLLYAGSAAGVQPTVGGILTAGLYVLLGLVMLYSVWFMTVTCSFWLVQVDNLDALFAPLFDAGRYPVSFFSGWMRALLTFVIPVAFATTFPVEAMLGERDASALLFGVPLAAAGLLLSHLLWNYAVRHYSSASS